MGFVAVGRTEKQAEVVVAAGYAVEKVSLLRIRHWELDKGAFPDRRCLEVEISIEGLSLVLYTKGWRP